MRQLLILTIIILSVFTVLALVCALWASVIREARPCRPDPFHHPFGDVPGFSDQQLREMTRKSADRIARDPLRRSFATRDLNSGLRCPPCGPEADGVGLGVASSRAPGVVRSFFMGWSHVG